MAEHTSDADRIVVALGGNALVEADSSWTYEDQLAVLEETATELATLLEVGTDLVLVHGNGPQVGNRLLEQEDAETPRLPLDVLVAGTQAEIGYPLGQALESAASGATVATVLTRIVVDPEDSAFEEPTKPVGPFYDEETAASKPFETRRTGKGERPYRRVVPSPEPLEVVERETIGRLLEREDAVICAGGGGVPVARGDALEGVEAVVDKDYTARLLGTELEADTLLFLTDVEYAYADYGGPDQRPLREVAVDELRTRLENDEFAPGSMGPKVRACCQFLERGGDRAVITTPGRLEAALAGETGTRVRP